jgi:thiol-disulfide isomerase/thioredoxin
MAKPAGKSGFIGIGTGAAAVAGILLALGAGQASGGSPAAKAELIPADAPRVLEEVRRPGASVVLVNVWATWCLPCREEFPDLMKLRRAWADRGLRLVLVSGDFPSDRPAVVKFLTARGVDFPTFLKDGNDMKFIDGLDSRWSGALPATFVYDGTGRLRSSWEGKADYASLERSVSDILNPRADSPAPNEEKKP